MPNGIASEEAPSSAIGALLGGMAPQASPDQMVQQISAQMGQLREIGAQVEALMQSNPAAAPTLQQILTLLKRAAVEMAPTAPPQTASGSAVPGGSV